MKILLAGLVLVVTLDARDNPFADQGFSTKVKLDIPKLVIPKSVEKIINKKPPKPKIIAPHIITKIIPKKVIPLAKTYPISKKIKKIVKHKKRVHKKKRYHKSKLLYSSKFLKIRLEKGYLKIITKDNLLQHLKLKSPYRLAFDFERYDVLPTVSKKVIDKHINHLKVGHHDYFYRITINTKKDYKRYTLRKKPYGYIIKL